MRRPRYILQEVGGIKTGIKATFAAHLLRDGLAEMVNGMIIELPRNRRAASTRYIDDPSHAGRVYKDEILSKIRQSRQNKPRSADDYVPLPFGFGREEAA